MAARKMVTSGSQLARSAPVTQTDKSISAILTRAQSLWTSMPAARRRGSMMAAGVIVVLIGFLSWWGVRTDWRTLYAGLDPDDARQLGIILSQAQIQYDVASNGTSILVPVPLLDKARLATAARGGVKSGRLGFELFDKPNWVGSEFDEQVNYRRALEGELEHTVGTLTDVESARVHLVLPRDSLFREQDRPAKGSVVLKLRHGALAEGEPEAIRNLVASAVDGLSPERVVLVDAAGRLALGPRSAEGLSLDAEQSLEEKLISTLEPVTGIGNVRASVTLDYDQAASDETDESYDPEQSATLSMQRTQQTSGAQPIPAGVPGTASNVPNSQPQPVYPKLNSYPETANSESGTYAVSKTTRHVIQRPGRMRRMTVAIVVNDRLLRAASKGSPAQWQPWPPDSLRNFAALAQAAVGYDSARGDVLTVQNFGFEDNRDEPVLSVPRQVLSTIERSPLLLKYGALMVGLLLVITFGVRPALGIARTTLTSTAGSIGKESRRDLIALGNEGVLGSGASAEQDPKRARTQEIFDQVASHLKREPAQSSRLLQSWIHSD